jgi:hypothetical protein
MAEVHFGKLRNGDVAANPAWMWSHYHVELDKVTLATATIRNIDSRTEQEQKIPKMKMFFTALQRVKHTSISISMPSTAHPCIAF